MTVEKLMASINAIVEDHKCSDIIRAMMPILVSSCFQNEVPKENFMKALGLYWDDAEKQYSKLKEKEKDHEV